MPNIVAAWILVCNRIIVAVRKHIEPQEALPGAAVGVCVEEALDDGVVISGLQVVEARLSERVVAIEAKKRSIRASKMLP